MTKQRALQQAVWFQGGLLVALLCAGTVGQSAEEPSHQAKEHVIISFGKKHHVVARFDSSLARKLAPEAAQKVAQAQAGQSLRVLVLLKEQRILPRAAMQLSLSLSEKAQVGVHTLRDAARQSQADLLSFLAAGQQGKKGAFTAQSSQVAGAVTSYKSFWAVNLVAVTATKEIIEQLAARDDVEKIFEDKIQEPPAPAPAALEGFNLAQTITDHLTWGLDRINVSQLWAQGYDGTGIIIGSIDTGVDTTHPDLIGKMAMTGSGSPGWYDAYAPPMIPVPIDDIGHGTHTIGTMVGGHANAQGISIGVAPGAQYYAARVFGRGPSYESMFLAAAQWMMDPDNNPQTTDFPRIINNSWGNTCPGTMDEWYRTLVKNWKTLGIIPVFAAGNGGDCYGEQPVASFGSISDPGNYPEALTVGATNSQDAIAPFSRKGPTTYDGREWIKPDVSAPGVYVISALATGTNMYADQQHFVGEDLYWANGTSMAAPHVAGACALLLQMHPEWTVDEISRALMAGAADIGADLFAQGHGRIDVAQAAAAELVSDPAHMDFGRLDASLEVWSKAELLRFTNVGTTARYYRLKIAAAFPAGANATISPSVLTLDPGQTAIVALTVSVDNRVVPPLPAAPFALEGAVLAQEPGSETVALRVPFAVRNPSTLTVRFLDGAAEALAIHNRQEWGDLYRVGGETLLLEVPATGLYDLWAYWPDNRLVVKEGVNVRGSTALAISRSEACHEQQLDPRNERNQPLRPSPRGDPFSQTKDWASSMQLFLLRHRTFPIGFGVLFSGFAEPRRMVVSTFSSAYTWSWLYRTMQDGRFYSLAGLEEHGIDRGYTFQNTPDDYAHFRLRFHIDPMILAATPEPWVWYAGDHHLGASLTADMFVLPVTSFLPAERVLQDPNSLLLLDLQESMTVKRRKLYSQALAPNDIYSMAPFFAFDRETVGYLKYAAEAPHEIEIELYRPGEVIPQIEVGLGPSYFGGRMSNSAEHIQLLDVPLLYQSQTGDLASDRLLIATGLDDYLIIADDGTAYLDDRSSLWRGNELIREDYNIDLIRTGLDLPPGPYTLRVPYEHYYAAGKTGQAEAILTFDTTQADPNPPYLHSLHVFSNDKMTDTVGPGQRNELQFEVRDDGAVSSVGLSYQTDGSWVSLPLGSDQGKSSALLPELPIGTEINLRIEAEDTAGNMLSATMRPATVVVANQPPVMEDIEDRQILEGQLLTFNVSATDPEGAPLIFEISPQPLPLLAYFVPLGDSTLDGQLTLEDAQFIRDHLSVAPLGPRWAAVSDVNEDGTVTLADAALIEALVASEIPPLNKYRFLWQTLYADAGTQTITFTISDANRQSTSQSVTITVTDEPLTLLRFKADPTAISPNGDTRNDNTLIMADFNHTPSSIILTIRNSTGRIVRTTNSRGTYNRWDGKDDRGHRVQNGIYTYTLTATDVGGSSASDSGLIRVDTIVPVISGLRVIPRFFRLLLGRKATITFRLSESSHIEMWLKNRAGVSVKTLLSNAALNAGTHSIVWDGLDDDGRLVSDGLYTLVIVGWDDAQNRAGPVSRTIDVIR